MMLYMRPGVLAFIGETIVKTAIKILAVITIAFALIRFMPGGPMDFIRARLLREQGTANEERINQLVQVYINVDPNTPLWQQYIDYLVSIFQGDLGRSFYYSEPVDAILGDALPWTILVMSISLLITFTIGVTLGAILAYAEGSRFDVSMSSSIVLLNGVPYYIAGLVFLYVLAYQWGLFPTGGRFNPRTTPGLNLPYLIGVMMHAALPILSIIITEFGGWALSMRGNSIQVLGEEYVRVAQLRGLSDRRISLWYVGRNAILPMYTGLLISIGFLFGGSVILERIFSYPGVGYYMVQAINARDYSLMMGGFLVITAAVIAGLLIADLTYGFLDPRIQEGDTHE